MKRAENSSTVDPAHSVPLAAPEVAFHMVHFFEGWAHAGAAVRRLIEQARARQVLEVGSGANPTLDRTTVQELGIEYTANDISAEELEKADACYRRLVLDVSEAEPVGDLVGAYDFIFSRMVNEHVVDGERYYRNLHRMLRPGGTTAHWFSTLYALPFLMNRLLPDALTDRLLHWFSPRDRHQHGKFKAHYSWSRGPSPRMIRRFETLGFEVVRYHGYYGHWYYRDRVSLLHRLEMAKSTWLARHPIPSLTSYAHVLLRKR